MTATVPVKKTESIFSDLENIHDRIMKRAYDIFAENGMQHGNDLEHWLEAERELVWKPEIELSEENNEYKLKVAVVGMDAKDLKVEVTVNDLVIKGETQHEHKDDKDQVHTSEFRSGSLYQSIHFPKPIDPNKVKAELSNGMLTLTAAISGEAAPRKVKIEIK